MQPSRSALSRPRSLGAPPASRGSCPCARARTEPSWAVATIRGAALQQVPAQRAGPASSIYGRALEYVRRARQKSKCARSVRSGICRRGVGSTGHSGAAHSIRRVDIPARRMMDRELYRVTTGVCRAVASPGAAGRPATRPDRPPGAPDPATDISRSPPTAS